MRISTRLLDLAIVLGVAVSLSILTLLLISPTGVGLAATPAKKLFDTRWYQQPNGNYQTWMTLSTSQLWLDCGTSTTDCNSRWSSPAQLAVTDWNGQPDTVRLLIEPDQSYLYDVNIFIDDLVLGDPSLAGLTLDYDQNANLCFSNCTIWFSQVSIGDLSHSGSYGTTVERRATIAHELGHVFALRHESVNSDESVQYACGMDDTGVIPYSIMSYNCIDPVSVGGFGIYQVQPWDVCGVNHAYYDPTIGYADCVTSTPTPSPTPQWSATNFRWYEALGSPTNLCDLTKPIPPGNPFTVGLCATFQLQIPDANYTLRTVWKRNGTTYFDNTYPNTHLYPGTWHSWVSVTQSGTYSLTQYANGVLLGTGQIVIASSATPTPTHSPTPTPTHSPTPTPTPTSTATDWHVSNFAWYENVVPGDGTSTCDQAKPVPPNAPYDAGLCVVFDLQIPNGSYDYRVLLTRNGVVVADATFPNVNLYSGPGWNQAFNPPAPGGNYDLKLYANGVLLGESNVTVPGPTPSPTPTAGSPTPTPSPTHTPIPPQTHSPSPTHTLPSDTHSPSPSPTPTATSIHPILGNANCDNRIDGADVIAILDHVGGIPDSAGCLGNADVDGDGFVTAFDGLLVLKYWAGVISTFPAGG